MVECLLVVECPFIVSVLYDQFFEAGT